MFPSKCTFDTGLYDANFVIPTNQMIRCELRQKLEYWLHSGVMWNPENKKARTILLCQLAAVEAYDEVFFEQKKKSLKT